MMRNFRLAMWYILCVLFFAKLTACGLEGTEIGNGQKPSDSPQPKDSHETTAYSEQTAEDIKNDTASEPMVNSQGDPVSDDSNTQLLSIYVLERLVLSCASPFLTASNIPEEWHIKKLNPQGEVLQTRELTVSQIEDDKGWVFLDQDGAARAELSIDGLTLDLMVADTLEEKEPLPYECIDPLQQEEQENTTVYTATLQSDISTLHLEWVQDQDDALLSIRILDDEENAEITVYRSALEILARPQGEK